MKQCDATPREARRGTALRMVAVSALLVLAVLVGGAHAGGRVATESTPSDALSWIRLDPARMLSVLDQVQGDQCRNHTKQLLEAAANLTGWASQSKSCHNTN